MLRVKDKSFDSNVGRQRQGNEDNFFVRPPLFVVADGMGGAQAGEVASQMAVEAFRSGLADEYEPEASLSEVIEQANSRIHELSRSDSQRQGMGTTCTAAYVGEDDVVLAHVGDSRCYLWRDGELSRLTTDHSLVGELVARGKITEEEAELHPQRSVITRALGPEGEVRVDTQRIAAREGDVFLLCSDGLTSMIREHTMLPIMREMTSLDDGVRSLIAAANDAGGRDNITVILFRIEEVEVAPGSAASSGVAGDGYDDFGSGAMRSDEQPTVAGEGAPATADVAEAVRAADAAGAPRDPYTVALAAIKPGTPAPETPGAGGAAEDAVTTPAPATGSSATPPPAPPAPTPAPAARPPAPAPVEPSFTRVPDPAAPSAPPPPAGKRQRGAGKRPKGKRKRRISGGLIAVLVVLAILLASAFIAIKAVFFVGVDDSTRVVTIYRGLPYDLPLGVKLYSRHQGGSTTIDQVPPRRRQTFTNHKLRSLTDAEDLVKTLDEGRLAP